jgi:hypothetical protein
MGGAGCAVLEDIGGALMNPSLLHAYNRTSEAKRFSVYAGFGTDSMFSVAAPAGIGYRAGAGVSIGLFGRAVRQSEFDHQEEAALVVSGRLFEKKFNRGAVDIGVALKGENMRWSLNRFPKMYTSTYYFKSDSTFLSSPDSAENCRIRERRVSLDVGIFQSRIAENLDFGLCVRNVTGWVWQAARPKVGHLYRMNIDTIETYPYTKDTVAEIDSFWYVDEYEKSGFWLRPWHKPVVAGIAYHYALEFYDIELTIPADVELIGLFGGEASTHIIVRCGIEATVYGNYFLRAGFSREPERFCDIGEAAWKNENLFFFGAGAYFFPVAFNMCFGSKGLGLETRVSF